MPSDRNSEEPACLPTGVPVIQANLKTLPNSPGVYRMLSTKGNVLYVGKAKNLKKRGWKFLGPTTVYSFMQAVGMVNDHIPECWVHPLIDTARERLSRPIQ